jgi:hypothetical protein
MVRGGGYAAGGRRAAAGLIQLGACVAAALAGRRRSRPGVQRPWRGGVPAERGTAGAAAGCARGRPGANLNTHISAATHALIGARSSWLTAGPADPIAAPERRLGAPEGWVSCGREDAQISLFGTRLRQRRRAGVCTRRSSASAPTRPYGGSRHRDGDLAAPPPRHRLAVPLGCAGGSQVCSLAGVMMRAAEKSVANCSGVPNIAPRRSVYLAR